MNRVNPYMPKLSDFLRKDNNNLDLVRILCAYFVIYSHAFALSPSPGHGDFLYSITGIGYIALSGVAVKMFFMISGLLVTNSLLSNGNVIRYAVARFLRVYPAFIFTVLISALVIFPWLSKLSIHDYFSSHETWKYIIRTLKMDIQYSLPGVFEKNTLNAVNGSLWTIPFEIKAYTYLLLIYLVSLAFGSYKKVFIGIMSLIIIIEPFTPFKGMLISKSNDPSIFFLYPFFAIGSLMAVMKLKLSMNKILVASIVFLLGFFMAKNIEMKIALFYAASVLFLLFISSLPLVRKLKIRSDISYGVYLWAFPTQQVVASIVPNSPYLNITIAIVISSILAYVSLIFIERPAMNLNKSFFKVKAS